MPISATGNRHKRQRGFTLVEVLTVALILGLVAGIVVLSLPAEDDRAKAEAFRFATRVTTAQELAVTRSQIIGLAATPDSYEFLVWRSGAWQAFYLPGADETLRSMPEGTQIDIRAEGEPATGTAGGERAFTIARSSEREAVVEPVLTFSPAGDVAAFSAYFAGERRDWQVIGTASGEVRVELAND